MQTTPEKLKKLQLILLDVLLEIKRICEKHNILFFLVGGTLLGAVRHKGFIPWDEDIDIAMTRDNFEKFCRIAPSELSKNYFLQTPFTDPQCFQYGMARVKVEGTKFIDTLEPENLIHNGFYLDIFVYDNIPDSFFWGFIHYWLFNLIVRILLFRNGFKPRFKGFRRFVLYISLFLFLPVSNQKICEFLANYHKKYENIKGKYKIPLRGIYGFSKERQLSAGFSNIKMTPFENHLMPVLENYESYLKNIYGDYMTPPPENKRKESHAVELDFGEY